MTRILITGAFGQIGTELTPELRRRYGNENVVATGHYLHAESAEMLSIGPVAELDVTNGEAISDAIAEYEVDTVFHLAAMLSARGERDPATTWSINIEGLRNVLDAARDAARDCRVFWPSSIAAFGPDTPRDLTPQDTLMRPTTMYGITKVAGELLCDYYCKRFGLDVRGVRYPGVISSEGPPGGGTTDYAVEMFHAALDVGRYKAFVRDDCVLPMIYMPDCLAAAIDLMSADATRLVHRNSFNIAAMSFSAGQLAEEIRKHIPEFVCEFEPDARQAIADTWPRSIEDSSARAEWGWRPHYDLARMTVHMLERLRARRDAGAH